MLWVQLQICRYLANTTSVHQMISNIPKLYDGVFSVNLFLGSMYLYLFFINEIEQSFCICFKK